VVFLGSGPLEADIHEWARRHGFESRVRVLLVKHSEVPRYVGAFDVLAAPSQTTPRWREQFGRMVIEAFACRVPVVVSDSGEPRFVVGDAGKVVPEADVKAWAETLGTLLESPTERDRLAEAGYQRCLSRYTNEVVARARLQFYRELMDVPVARG
jgi:glycosyltransferase involved in cell wall biosynthesis